MKRILMIGLVLSACAPSYKSGVTECSDNLECPSGYYCAIANYTCIKGSAPLNTGGVVAATGGVVAATGGTTTPIGTGGSGVGRDGGVDIGPVAVVDAAPGSDGAPRTGGTVARDAGVGRDVVGLPDISWDTARTADAVRMDTAPTTDVGTWQSNSNSFLEGTAIGTGISPTSSLLRTVPLTASAPNVTLSNLILTRPYVDSTYAQTFIGIKNTGTTLLCSPTITLQLYDSSGGLVASLKTNLLGSVGYTNTATGTTYTDTCLQPNEFTYLISGENNIFSTTARATLVMTWNTSYTFKMATASIEATQWTESDGYEIIKVKNTGTSAAKLASDHIVVVLLDADYVPIYWDYLSVVTGYETLAPGGYGYLTDDGFLLDYSDGSAPYQFFHVHFAGPAVSALQTVSALEIPAAASRRFSARQEATTPALIRRTFR